MALVTLPGSMMVPIGMGYIKSAGVSVGATSLTMDAVGEAIIMIGHIVTADGGSHTIDTSGSSSIGWITGTTITFASASTTVKVGIAAVDTANGPPGRAVNVADVITFDVSKSLVGGGGGITGAAWQTHVPDSGTKTIANGDLIAVCMQMTARGGTDAVRVACSDATIQHLPVVTAFVSAAYTAMASSPNTIITFSDGTLGYFFASDVMATSNTRLWNSGSAQAEYGQLFQLPFGMKVSGLWAWVAPANDLNMVLYSDPLGTPIAEKTIAIDANTMSAVSGRKVTVQFASPIAIRPNQPIVVSLQPGAGNITAYYKRLQSATHRIADPWGLFGYGVQRVSGAFSDSNSSLDHYYMGLMASAFENPAGAAYQLGMS